MTTTSKIPSLAAFGLDAYGHLTWGVGYNDQFDPEENPLVVIAKADQMTDEEIEEADLFPRDCGDWTAWVDAKRLGDYVGYHVVVDSDTGGFTDTMESGVLTVEEARKQLPSLLEGWRATASEHLSMSDTWFTKEETEEDFKTIKRWKDYLKELLK